VVPITPFATTPTGVQFDLTFTTTSGLESSIEYNRNKTVEITGSPVNFEGLTQIFAGTGNLLLAVWGSGASPSSPAGAPLLVTQSSVVIISPNIVFGNRLSSTRVQAAGALPNYNLGLFPGLMKMNTPLRLTDAQRVTYLGVTAGTTLTPSVFVAWSALFTAITITDPAGSSSSLIAAFGVNAIPNVDGVGAINYIYGMDASSFDFGVLSGPYLASPGVVATVSIVVDSQLQNIVTTSAADLTTTCSAQGISQDVFGVTLIHSWSSPGGGYVRVLSLFAYPVNSPSNC